MPAERPQADGRSRELTDEGGRGEVRERLDQQGHVVFTELKRVAHRRLAVERGGRSLSTALVHEAYLRLAEQRHGAWDERGRSSHWRAVRCAVSSWTMHGATGYSAVAVARCRSRVADFGIARASESAAQDRLTTTCCVCRSRAGGMWVPCGQACCRIDDDK